ncbi:UxaA family hydrolase [Zooshikella ganghwensis]|uniref:Carbohydrate kinase n=1 Tax=Zooshikella ganghwensis TaxID=202772 RepID=A0A4P9VM89_9GAMM|nr:UxaA family hydrolase [Zooshikella ganghwensis]RDH43022.1 carbohydrate kinase [Zooshikella ganghwensis]
MNKAIRLNAADNVATLLADVQNGEQIHVISASNELEGVITLLQDIPFGNKVAWQPMQQGQTVIKGSFSIGKSIKPIAIGQMVHVHNVRSLKLDIPDAIIQQIIQQMNIQEDV